MLRAAPGWAAAGGARALRGALLLAALVGLLGAGLGGCACTHPDAPGPVHAGASDCHGAASATDASRAGPDAGHGEPAGHAACDCPEGHCLGPSSVPATAWTNASSGVGGVPPLATAPQLVLPAVPAAAEPGRARVPPPRPVGALPLRNRSLRL